jgi:hypothetical protein
VGDPISTESVKVRDMETLSEKTRNVVADLYYARSPLPDMRKECVESTESGN